MARHSLHFRAFFNVRPHVISGHPFGRECATQPVSNCRGARVIGIRETWPAHNEESDCDSSYQGPWHWAFKKEWLSQCDNGRGQELSRSGDPEGECRPFPSKFDRFVAAPGCFFKLHAEPTPQATSSPHYYMRCCPLKSTREHVNRTLHIIRKPTSAYVPSS